MIGFDTHDVLCLVSSIVLILSLFYDWVDTYDVLCLVSSIVLIHRVFYVLCQDIG